MSDEHQECQDANPLEGEYANYFKVGYNAFEFILDFGQFYSESLEKKGGRKVIEENRLIFCAGVRASSS
jgi:hypothetical protein